jgi:hypothetical protein
VLQLDVIGTPVTLSERDADELRAAAAADAGRSSARRDLALLLERALPMRTPLRSAASKEVDRPHGLRETSARVLPAYFK